MRRYILLSSPISITCLILLTATPASASIRIAIAVFEMPDALRARVAPKTLTDLLLKAGRDGLTSNAILPDAYLAEVIKRYRTELMLAPPDPKALESIDPKKIRADRLLLPAVSKLNDTWEMTATLVEIKTFDSKVIRVSGPGGDDALPDLIETLWREVDQPRQRFVFNGHQRKVNGVAISPDGMLLASASRDGTVMLCDTKTGKLKATLKGHERGMESVAFSPDGSILAASAAWDGAIFRWETKNWQERPMLKIPSSMIVQALVFRPDGKTLVAGSTDGVVSFFDPETGKDVRPALSAQKMIFRLAFSPDGNYLAITASRSPLQLIHLGSGQAQKDIVKLGAQIQSAAFSPDGKTLAAGDFENGEVRLWDVEYHRIRATLRGHKEAVNTLAFSPDGKLLASGSRDNTIRIWDSTTGRLRALFKDHGGAVSSVAFGPNSNLLASGSWWDRTVRLWGWD